MVNYFGVDTSKFNPTRNSYLVQQNAFCLHRYNVFMRAGLNKDGNCLAGA